MFWSTHDRMRTRACQHDNGRIIVLAMVVTAAIMSLGAIVAELALAKDIEGALRDFHIAPAATTILSSWAFTQVMFALHDAQDDCVAEMKECPGGLEFPGGHAPDNGDFLPFARVIGTSVQTADVSFTCLSMRRAGLVHCVRFFFNTTQLALMINIASGMF